MKLSRLNLSVLLISIILIADQVLKFWIKTNMSLGDEIHAAGNWFIIHFVENNGMAFGFEFAGEYGKMFLSIFRIIAVIGIGWFIWHIVKREVPRGFIISLSLIFAGALGNIIDSVFYGMLFSHSFGQVAEFLPEGGGYAGFLHGKVVDMFYFPILKGFYPHWFPFWAGNEFIFFRPVFNIADASITTGIFSILIFYRNYFNEHTSRNKSTEHDDSQNDDASDRAGRTEDTTVGDSSSKTKVVSSDSVPEAPVKNGGEMVS